MPPSRGVYLAVFFGFITMHSMVVCESDEGNPGVCASRVPLPFLPFVFAYWWIRLTPRGCSVFLA